MKKKYIFIIVAIVILLSGGIFLTNTLKNKEKKEETPIDTSRTDIIEDSFPLFKEVTAIDNAIYSETKIFDKIEYEIELTEDIEEIMASKNYNEYASFYSIDEGDVFAYGDEYITLVKGVPYIVNSEKKVASSIVDIKRIYLIFGDYNHNQIFLTQEGEVYIGESYVYTETNEETGEVTYRLANNMEWNKLDKLGTPNKYNEIRLSYFENENVKSEDKAHYNLIGISKGGKRDLFKIKY